MKTINGTIKLRDLTLTDATYEVKNPIYDLETKTCIIEVIFDTDKVIKYSYSVSGFDIKKVWEDADIFAFVEAELEKLKV